jgi:hypothetical protein
MSNNSFDGLFVTMRDDAVAGSVLWAMSALLHSLAYTGLAQDEEDRATNLLRAAVRLDAATCVANLRPVNELALLL